MTRDRLYEIAARAMSRAGDSWESFSQDARDAWTREVKPAVDALLESGLQLVGYVIPEHELVNGEVDPGNVVVTPSPYFGDERDVAVFRIREEQP